MPFTLLAESGKVAGGGGVNGSDLQGSLTVKSRGGNLTQNAEAFPERLQIEEEVRNCL